MDPTLVAISAHSVERIFAVVMGGISIYYGFRLFLALPTETRSDGKINLPGMSVVLAKAGPGLFFAAFGALIVMVSLFKPISVDADSIHYVGATARAASEPRHPTVREARLVTPQDVEKARTSIQSIDCMMALAKAAGRYPPTDFEIAARDAKLALLERVWDPGAWGDFEAFRQWASGVSLETASPARAIFESRRAGCPA